jgi:hypothetical protein
MEDIINEYRQWKMSNPDIDYQYDEIHNFMAGIGRGGQLEVMEWLDSILSRFPELMK